MIRVGGFAAAALVAMAAPAWSQTYLVSVGNNLGRATEPELRYAEADADRVAAVLRELGPVAPEREIVVRGGDAAAVRSALLRTNARLRRAPPDVAAALIVYYSGHADAEGLHLGDSTMAFDELKTIVESSPARVRVLIVDSCRSGGITRVKGVRPAEPFDIRVDDRVDVEGLAIITSSSGSEDSQESDTLRASFFTHHFVNALKGAADRNRDGRVTLQEAYSYAYQETIRSSGRTLQLQHPTYAYDLKGKGDFVLTSLAEGQGRFGTLAIADPGTYLIYEGESQGVLTAEVHVREEGARLLLTPGRYFVQRRDRTSYREYRAKLSREGIVALDALEYREIKYSRLLRKGGGDRAALHQLAVGAELRGPLLEDFSVTPSALLGYGLDLAPISLGLQLRLARGTSDVSLGTIAYEIGLRLRGDHYFDLDGFSLSVGLWAEGASVTQVYDTNGSAPDRQGFIFGGGATVGLERSFGRLVVRLEGGPAIYGVRTATTRGGAAVGDELQTPLTYRAGLGLGWRL